MNRRHFMGLSGSAALVACLPGQAFADQPTGKALHGLSAFGDVKYGPDFSHFDYANPDAPKGGCFTLAPLDGYGIRTRLPSTRSTRSPSRAMRRRAWN